MAAVIVPPSWDRIWPDDRIEQLEARVERLERVWREHDKTYHFICEYEDCMTTNESLKLPAWEE
jgi:hypothetical protein